MSIKKVFVPGWIFSTLNKKKKIPFGLHNAMEVLFTFFPININIDFVINLLFFYYISTRYNNIILPRYNNNILFIYLHSDDPLRLTKNIKPKKKMFIIIKSLSRTRNGGKSHKYLGHAAKYNIILCYIIHTPSDPNYSRTWLPTSPTSLGDFYIII